MAWAAETNIKGQKGDKGDPGATGAPGAPGAPGADGAGAPGTAPPLMDGVATVGTSMLFSRQDHIHPGDTAKADKTYVDNQNTAQNTATATADNLRVLRAGDTMTGALTVALTGAPTTGTYYFGNSGTKQLTYDGTNFTLAGGQLLVGSNGVWSGAGGATGLYLFGSTGTKYLSYDGIYFNFVGGLTNVVEPPQTDRSVAAPTTNWVKTWAAPFDALAYNGMQVNGGFTVSQEKGLGAGVTAFGSYVCDNWMMTGAGTQVVSSSILAGTAAMLAVGLTNCLAAAVTGSAPSLGATDSTTFLQRVEGYRVARLGWGFPSAQPITISFFTAHNRAGTYSVVARNSAATRSYATTYTQNVSDALEYKSVTIPGCTDGVWATDNTIGLLLQFAMACGTTQTAPSANSWLAGVYVAAPGQVNAVAANTDRFRLTDVVVLPGIEAPSAARAPLILRPYDQELLTCMRYCYKRVFNPNQVLATLQAYTTTTASGAIMDFPVQMRAIPTIITSGSFGLANANGAVTNLSGGGLTATQDGLSINGAAVASAVLIAGNATLFMQTAAGGGYYLMDARL